MGVTTYLKVLFLSLLAFEFSLPLQWCQGGVLLGEVGITMYHKFFLKFPGLLLFLLMFEFLSPLFILRWSQNDGLLGKVGS